MVALMVLFVGVVVTQMVVSDKLQSGHARRADRLEAARDANVAVLQHMTDAETGVRGFQLSGDKAFLDPYDKGRAGAFTALDEVTTESTDPTVLRRLVDERAAASRWLYAYAYPIVNAGVADPRFARTARGKQLFDDIRITNAAVDAAIHAEQQRVAAADRRLSWLAQVLFALLAVGFLGVVLLFASFGRRLLLAPLEHMRETLQRLAAGELSARAVPAGPAEMRAVTGTLNRLAAETERLLTADVARAARTDLRQAVSVALRDNRDPVVTARQVAALVSDALGADAVHGQVSVDATNGIKVRWPANAPSLSARVVRDILDGAPGVVLDVPHVEGAVAVPLGGDADCPPGLLYVVRHDRPEWSADERRLLATLAREVDHAVRQQRLQYRQARLINELRVLDERKDAFVATVTHELRTPLTSILGYTEMLADGDGGELSTMQQRGVTAILRNAHRLHETVSDLLLLDRANNTVGAGAVRVDLSAVTATVHAEFEPVARGREVTLTGTAEPVWVDGDAGQLERVLRNLLDNAMKFTGSGGEVTYGLCARDGRAVLTVTDTGIGIPEGDLAGLFTPFHRAANAMDQAVQGSGLGLAIVRNIVTEHGGSVTVSSRLAHGSTFTVSLPLVPAPLPA
ncbi:putative two-component system sensor kinase [Actinoplanes friuliensis DSM 7358]|uniref:histidine kinase n=1 Tax=Actinoplanes friuliensis DSM 7358 TaxID=1246995 RepID=U5W242_9ACTN|nr:putative two-component system sensor kinase [Actinoplanes friuliensis DSM 7358]